MPSNSRPWPSWWPHLFMDRIRSSRIPSKTVLYHNKSKSRALIGQLATPICPWVHADVGEAPTALSYLTNKPCTAYNFRRSNNIIVPPFNSQFLKNSTSYRGAILWNADSFFRPAYCFLSQVKKDSYFKELDFSAQSVQSLPGHYQDFTEMLLTILMFFIFMVLLRGN